MSVIFIVFSSGAVIASYKCLHQLKQQHLQVPPPAIDPLLPLSRVENPTQLILYLLTAILLLNTLKHSPGLALLFFHRLSAEQSDRGNFENYK